MNIMIRINKIAKELESAVLDLGADKAKIIPIEKVELDRSFRAMCESNACGVYGKCHTCPPDVGDIDELMAEVRKYKFALVYQRVSELEDSYDFEGMFEAKRSFRPISQNLREIFRAKGINNALHLSVGGCGICPICAKRIDSPCRFPDKAMASLEAYGVNVSRLAAASGMKYINGQNTVTYFGAVFFTPENGNE